MKKTKSPERKPADLQPKSSGAVKGGGVSWNDNITFVRAAKPAATKKKDLTARKDVKGGIKQR